MEATGDPPSTRRRLRKPIAIACVVLALLGCGAYVAYRVVLVPAVENTQSSKSADNISGLLQYYIGAGYGTKRPWPSVDGKAFILWLVATNQLNKQDARALRILFSPADESRSLEAAGGVRAYAHLVPDSLRDGTLDVTKLTSYVGRRAAAEQSASAVDNERGVPLIADLSFRDFAIIGYSNGQARRVDRDELGLAASDPIVAGEASKSPLLRQFSEK